MIIAAYLGSFDPMTLGHLDVIARVSKIFDQVIIGITTQTTKVSCFSLEQRFSQVKASCEGFANVQVEIFSGLAIDFARTHKVKVLVRGLRTEADYVYEMQMAMMNRTLDKDIETVFVPTRQDLSHVSSSLVREVAALGGEVAQLVPPVVNKELKKKYGR
jgi:pantetheine-phosphate adenylyltransferase